MRSALAKGKPYTSPDEMKILRFAYGIVALVSVSFFGLGSPRSALTSM
jgi:hypothetical protein